MTTNQNLELALRDYLKKRSEIYWKKITPTSRRPKGYEAEKIPRDDLSRIMEIISNPQLAKTVAILTMGMDGTKAGLLIIRERITVVHPEKLYILFSLVQEMDPDGGRANSLMSETYLRAIAASQANRPKREIDVDLHDPYCFSSVEAAAKHWQSLGTAHPTPPASKPTAYTTGTFAAVKDILNSDKSNKKP